MAGKPLRILATLRSSRDYYNYIREWGILLSAIHQVRLLGHVYWKTLHFYTCPQDLRHCLQQVRHNKRQSACPFGIQLLLP